MRKEKVDCSGDRMKFCDCVRTRACLQDKLEESGHEGREECEESSAHLAEQRQRKFTLTLTGRFLIKGSIFYHCSQ